MEFTFWCMFLVTRCFLNPVDGFIWSLIAPFIVIFITNIGLFVMAAWISWHRRMRGNENKNISLTIDWLKSIVPLVVVLGLTWIIGVVIVEVEAIVPLAYIYTIMVAFQGL